MYYDRYMQCMCIAYQTNESNTIGNVEIIRTEDGNVKMKTFLCGNNKGTYC